MGQHRARYIIGELWHTKYNIIGVILILDQIQLDYFTFIVVFSIFWHIAPQLKKGVTIRIVTPFYFAVKFRLFVEHAAFDCSYGFGIGSGN